MPLIEIPVEGRILPIMEWIGLIAVLVLLTAAQEFFYETHRRRYGPWRSTRERLLWANPDERRLMWNAVMHRDSDPHVERSRLFLIGAVLVGVLAAFALVRFAGR